MLHNKHIEFKFFDKTFKQSTHTYGLHRFQKNEFDERNIVLDNYAAIMKALNAKKLLILHHVYSPHVVDADRIEDFTHEPDADAAVTSKPGIILSVQTADCIPVLLADNEVNVIGAAHCSWHCAKDNLLANTISMMQTKGAKNISAIIGPGIQQHSYEVDQPFYKAIIESEPCAQSLFITAAKHGHYFFDLPGFCILKLKKAGIVDIINLSEDTFTHEHKYHSYRRDKHLNVKNRRGNLLSTILIR